MRTYRYFEWATASGGQLSGDQLMDALSDYLTEDGDVSRAMQMLMQRGMSSGEQKMQGLRDMLEQLRKRKQQQLDKYDLNSLLNDVRRQLDQLLQQGRQADFQQFKGQHPQFPSAQEETIEELIQQLQHHLQQWRSLLESLSESVRRELEQLMDSSLDADLQAQRAELQELLDQLATKKLAPQRYRFKGREEISLEQAQELIEQLQQLE